MDIGVGADPADDLALVVARRHRPRQKPPERAIGAAQAEFNFVTFAAADRLGPDGDRARNIVGVNDLAPLIAVEFAGTGACIFINARVEPVQQPIGPCGPDMVRHGFGERAEFRFALPQRLLGDHLLGDIGVRADQPYGLSGLVALDGGSHRNPARLAVAWANDPVLRGIVANFARDGITEFLFGGLPIVGMDAPDPVLVGFVDRFRRQPVNQQIFRRPAIVEAGPQIDFKAADPADLLDPRQFGLAFTQRRGRAPLAGDVAANHQDSTDATAIVDRAVAVGPQMLPQAAAMGDRQQLIFVRCPLAGAHDLLDLRTQDAPDFVPAFPAALAQRGRMEVGPRGLAIGVIIELNELRTPPEQHRVVGIQQQAHSRPQALRPGLRRPQRTSRPAVSAR